MSKVGRLSAFFLAAWLGCIGFVAAQATATQTEATVFIQKGTIPIIVSAPHGGRTKLHDIPERQGDGAKKFVAVRDENTSELAEALITELERVLRGKPYAVIARFERKYIDVNRAPKDGFESELARPHYERYHAALDQFAREIKEKWQGGLLVDIHGQAAYPDQLIRGTNNGETVEALVNRYGREALIGPKSLFGAMKKTGYDILPALNSSEKEISRFDGGYIVSTYGSNRPGGIDAIQMEFGSNYRVPKSAATKSARDTAAAIHAYCQSYLKQALNN